MHGGKAPTDLETVNHDEAPTDAALVGEARKGHFQAFEELVRRHQKRIYAVCVGMLKNPAEAEEVVQDTFLSAFEKLPTLRGDAAFGGWVTKVAVNHCMMRLRKKRPTAAGGLAELEEQAGDAIGLPLAAEKARLPDDIVEEKRMSEALDRALDTLTPEARAIILLRAHGMSVREVAEVLEISVANAKVRLHRGRLAIREALQKAEQAN